jgi:8-oxo-dGTP diphosphatase
MTRKQIRRSGRAIVIPEERIALLQRDRGGQIYYVFPGGGIEGDETPEGAAVREVYEELGIVVRPEKLVAVVQWGEHTMYFYQVAVIGGTFGSGSGAEFHSNSPERGTYTPVWLDVSSLTSVDVRPEEVAVGIAAGTLLAQAAPPTFTIPSA